MVIRACDRCGNTNKDICDCYKKCSRCDKLFRKVLIVCAPSRSIREVRQRMSAVADSSTNIVTNLRDVIDVPVPVIDVGDSSLRVAVTFK